MPKVSSKRQITLPIEQCRQAGIQPGDEYDSFIDNDGHITIIKKIAGAAKGILANVNVNANHALSDEDSLQDGLSI